MIKKITARLIILKQLVKAIFNDKVILVYQMGKVGSTSVYRGLLKHQHSPVFQIHRFNLKNNQYVNRGPLRTFFRMLWANFLYRIVNSKKLIIITTTRSPIKRNISDFFQTLDFFLHANNESIRIETDDLIKIFLEQYPHFSGATWFDFQLKSVFGLDVYRDPYKWLGNTVRVYKTDKITTYLYRMEDIEQSYKDIMLILAGKEIPLELVNKGDNKWYSQLYSEFIEAFQAPEWYRNMIQNTDYFNFFYGQNKP